MVKIGITGGIGSGKTTVCKIFELMGVPVYNADQEAKRLQEEVPQIREEIIEALGTQAYLPNGTLDRKWVAQEVFKNTEKLKQLNAIVHPRIQQDFEDWTKRQTSKMVLKEAALLIEAESYKALDGLILVTAPKELRIARVLKRDAHRTKEDVEAIMDKQIETEKAVKFAQWCIVNDEERSLIEQVESVVRDLLG